MKKIMPIMICIAASLLFAMPCMADSFTFGTTNSLTVEGSANVSLNYEVTAEADHFTITGVNSQGTMEYGVSSFDNLVYYQEVATGSSATEITADGSSNPFSGWTAMGS